MTSTVVIDNGTGFTKLGYAGNYDPQFVFPTAVATHDLSRPGASSSSSKRTGLDDLDFFVGDEALTNSKSYDISYPMTAGQVENWDQMERLWEHCFFKYLRCEPDEHYCLVTEPPMNAPENREYTAEIMFETFNVKGLHIAVQAVLALAASWDSKKAVELGLQGSATGTVVDSGDGVTHIIPVADGYVIGSAIKHIPLAGRNISEFVSELLRQRENIATEDAKAIAQKVKEEFCYICKDVAEEYAAFDANPAKFIKQWSGTSMRTGQKFTVDIGHEMFLGPEIFFSPEMFSGDYTVPLPELVDQTIMSSPLDCRRSLYNNIVLSGGSTMFKNFGRRLQRDISHLVEERIRESALRSRRSIENLDFPTVNVITHGLQRYAVWYGGSQLACLPDFPRTVATKEEYEEIGPSICRQSRAVFSALTL